MEKTNSTSGRRRGDRQRARSPRASPRIAERYASMIPNIGLSDRTNCQRPADQLGGIDHRRDVHQDLHQERDDVLEVAIEDRQRRQRARPCPAWRRASAGSEAAARRLPSSAPRRSRASGSRVDDQRDQQVDQEDRGGGDRHEEPGEVDLGQQVLLIDQAQGRLRASPARRASRGSARRRRTPGRGSPRRRPGRIARRSTVKITIMISGWRIAQAGPSTVCLYRTEMSRQTRKRSSSRCDHISFQSMAIQPDRGRITVSWSDIRHAPGVGRRRVGVLGSAGTPRRRAAQ